ncbi:guanylate kinase [Coraliomargarita akajimensis]|uniref:Guanylate kinase n=1 Tax=Coraliomargarita akajimensis (strain DSM 45221 / IAM 15411 / JCM 23193 / KCTC 12865 / 04OKA010-24) TaxID=583355 RepID=D5ELL4_CORAD|nr:guanylate kinase [Coraliomargarita akajimensis]ADE55150.1 guanylate kinase [Coraliomargarita akajimensis DSM 45221]
MDSRLSSKSGILIIVSGPAGSGKTTVCDRVLSNVAAIERAITSTTRAPRGEEKDTVDYYFFDRPTFEAKIEAGDFYEYAHVHSNLYGTLKSEVQSKLNAGVDILLNIDVQGAAQMRETAKADALLKGRVITVFIMPPSVEELEKRLRGRGTDAEDEVQRRMTVALEEMKQANDYDYVLLSASMDEDFESLRSIYRAEKMRVRD